jgi:hypothetical protein
MTMLTLVAGQARGREARSKDFPNLRRVSADDVAAGSKTVLTPSRLSASPSMGAERAEASTRWRQLRGSVTQS